MRPRLLIVDDSLLCRAALRAILEAADDLEVVGEAADGREALRLCAALRPDLATIDINMPGMGGLELIERIMAEHPLPLLVVTSEPVGPGTDLAFQAVRRGALDLSAKPSPRDAQACAALRAQVRLLARVPVVRHMAGGAFHPGPGPASEGPAAPALSIRGGGRRVIGIGASTGGPAAIATVLGGLPAHFPAGIVLVQHLPVGFVESFARFLRDSTRLRIEVAGAEAALRAGTVLVAPDHRHLIGSREGRFRQSDAPPIGGHRPSATALFNSLAEAFGPAAVGVVLTGMGDDGAAGLAQMQRSGALTIIQSRQTSAVAGMPGAAMAAVAGARVLDLLAIAGALIEATGAPMPDAGHRRRAASLESSGEQHQGETHGETQGPGRR